MKQRRRWILPGLLGVLWSACSPTPQVEPLTSPDADGAPAGIRPEHPVDLVLHGGRILDGSGGASFEGEVWVRDGVILAITSGETGPWEAREVVDVRGRIVAPGFIDLHAHGDPLETPDFPNFLAMGVTTVVLGQDGTSPLDRDAAGKFAAWIARGATVNQAWFVGHNSLRVQEGIGLAPPTPVQISSLLDRLTAGLDAGAFGLSLGLEYDPGRQATIEELATLAHRVADHGGIVVSHLRNEDADAVEAALAELLEIGARSGAPVHASHLKVVLGNDPTQAERLLEAMAEARLTGHTVTGDVYPYTASFTGLSILFPDWARPPFDAQDAARQRPEDLAAHLRTRVLSRNGPGAMLFGTGPWAGESLEAVAARQNRPFEEILIDLGPTGAQAAYFVMDEGVMRRILKDPFIAVASDGGPIMRHPRGYGTFARVLRWTQEEPDFLALGEAVRKMTSLPASILGLDNPDRVDRPRGRLLPGWAADLVVFDPAQVRDRADFPDPFQWAEGVDGVWVNGVRVWKDGGPEVSSGLSRPGQVLRARPGRGPSLKEGN
jgi:N-acyl-D-amino-acid deacylase